MLNLTILNISKDQINILSFQIGNKLINCLKNILQETGKLVLRYFMNLALFWSTLLDWWWKKNTLSTPLAKIMDLICYICWIFQYYTQVINNNTECNIPRVLLQWFSSHEDFINSEVKLICYWHFLFSNVKILGKKIRKLNFKCSITVDKICKNWQF